jgi:hypothetical protein
MISNEKKYPSFHLSSGINSKFIPYTPTIKVRGKKNAEKMVNNLTTSLFF